MLDVLAELPLDVVADNLWQPLPPSSRRDLRLLSRQSLLLANDLITSATYAFPHDAADRPSDDPESDPDALQDDGQLDHTARQWVGLMQRLPRLSSLQLDNCPSTADLAPTLVQFGSACQGRVTRLTLTGGTHNMSTACAIRIACPRLRELCLTDFGDDDEEDELNCCYLTGDMLLPMHDASLTKLELNGSMQLSDRTFLSLAGLSHLRHLDLWIDSISAHHLPPLTALTNLQHCELGCASAAAPSWSLWESWPLFMLTRLTHLGLLALRHEDASADPAPLPATPPATLSSLQHLKSPRLRYHTGHPFAVQDAVLADLDQVTQLNALEVGCVAPARCAPGHLRFLQHLSTHPHRVRPHVLLQTLLPLLPLPSLLTLNRHCVSNKSRLAVELGVVGSGAAGAADAEAQWEALRSAAQHLAAAPRLQLEEVSVHVRSDGYPAPAQQLSLCQIVLGLQPLATRIRYLALFHLTVGSGGWLEVGALFVHLSRLVLTFSSVHDAGLVAVAQHLTAMRRLDLLTTGEVTEEGWLGVSVVRALPLLLVAGQQSGLGNPPLSDELVSRCRAVQLQQHGRQSIEWATFSNDWLEDEDTYFLL